MTSDITFEYVTETHMEAKFMEQKKDYEVEELELTELSPNKNGMYQELTIDNYTNVDIATIDRFGNISVINKEGDRYRNQIIIYVRSCIGKRVDEKQNIVPLTSKKIIVQRDQLDGDGIFLKEIDMVLCEADEADVVLHPAQYKSIENQFDEYIGSLITSGSILHGYVIANDPNEVYDQIYMQFMGNEYEIPVTHFDSEESCIKLAVAGNSLYDQKSIKLTFNEIENDNGFIELNTGEVLHISTRIDKLRAGLHNIQKKGKVTTEQIDNLLKDRDEQHEQEKQELKEKYDRQIEELKNTIAKKDSEINGLKETEERLRGIISKYEAQGDYEKEKLKHESQVFRKEATEETAKKAESSRKSEQWKSVVTVLTSVVAIVSLVASFLL